MRLRLLLIVIFGFSASLPSSGYSVLTHEAIIDAAWKDNIRPLLQKRFPKTSEDALRDALAHAYGGAIIQDIGYYPFGSKLVTDLMHYVRSGDFIVNLIAEAQDVNEYAFALGALAHYAADNHGHRAVNRAVPMLFPKMRKKFGDIVTYADSPSSHLKTEFAFDVAQVAKGNYASDSYHQLIGFEVSEAVLERAFLKTYGLELADLISNKALALGTYRFAVSSMIPAMTKAAWELKRDELIKTRPGLTQQKFIYNLSKSEFQRKWGRKYKGPGVRARIIAFFIRVMPKIGPCKIFAFHPATPETEKMFMESVNQTLDQYRGLLTAHARRSLKLDNGNFDTGGALKPGAYRLADEAYASLLDKLEGKAIPPELRTAILAYYSDLNATFATKEEPKEWQKVLTRLDALKAAAPAGSR